MVIGYMRVSKRSQDTALQQDALEKFGVDRIYTDKASGVKVRDELNKVLEILRKGDTLVVWKLDRLGRTTKELLGLIEYFEKEKIHFISLQENIDTTTPMGRFMVTIFCALAAMERDVLIMRTRAGLEAAKARGRVGGRPPVPREKLEKAIKLYHTKTHSIKEIVTICGVSQATLYRELKKQREGRVVND